MWTNVLIVDNYETLLANCHRHILATEKVSYCVDGFSRLLYNRAEDALAQY
jgi:hypothetical protein